MDRRKATAKYGRPSRRYLTSVRVKIMPVSSSSQGEHPDPFDDLAFREEVRQFIAETLPPEVALRNRFGFHSSREDMQFWARACYDRGGWSTPTWPKEHGGPGWTVRQQQIFDEERQKAGTPALPQGPWLVGPVIYTFGTPEQKEQFLAPTARGDILWGQGFSEPNAGSDLTSLQTRAVLDGDHYVVNGQKAWMTDGHKANWLFCLVRTGTEPRGGKGLSFLLIPADTPGVTIRPTITIDEGHSLNEVFLDDVRVPATNLIGQPGEGWTYARFLLGNERSSSAETPRCAAGIARLRDVAIARADKAGNLLDDPVFAARLATLEIELMALEMSVERTVALPDGGKAFAMSSMLKLCGSELMQAISELTVEALGEDGVIYYPEDSLVRDDAPPGSEYAAGVLADALYRRATTIYGGSGQIQRDLISRHVLSGEQL